MTIQEFDNTSFRKGDEALYKGVIYLLCSVDFEEKLIGILIISEYLEDRDIKWVRCENIEYMPKL